jgi:hypothetical protein
MTHRFNNVVSARFGPAAEFALGGGRGVGVVVGVLVGRDRIGVGTG